MSGLWVVVIMVAVLIAFRALESRLFSGPVTTSRTFWCPFRRRNVTVAFSESVWDGRFDVQSCDAFAPPGAVGCDRTCLNLKTLPEAKVQPPEPPLRSWEW